MGRYGLLHLYLHLAVGGVDVVELLLAAFPQVAFLLGIQIFVEVEQRSLSAQLQPEVVEARIAEVGRRLVLL